jgi:hydrogenase maturation protease
MKPVVCIGLGNPLRTDEGVGVRVVEALRAAGGAPADCEILDLGTAGPALLHALAGRRKAVIVDCTLMGEAPGMCRRFRPEEVRTKKALAGLSVHEADVLRILALSEELGERPEEVVLFGIEPASIEAGTELSPALREGLDGYVAAVRAELGGRADA